MQPDWIKRKVQENENWKFLITFEPWFPCPNLGVFELVGLAGASFCELGMSLEFIFIFRAHTLSLETLMQVKSRPARRDSFYHCEIYMEGRNCKKGWRKAYYQVPTQARHIRLVNMNSLLLSSLSKTRKTFACQEKTELLRTSVVNYVHLLMITYLLKK